MLQILLIVIIITGIVIALTLDKFCIRALKNLRVEQSKYDWKVTFLEKDKFIIENRHEQQALKNQQPVPYDEGTIYRSEISARYHLETYMRKNK